MNRSDAQKTRPPSGHGLFGALAVVVALLPGPRARAASQAFAEHAPAGATAAVSFADIGAVLPTVSYASTAWGDYDNDGDLDLLITGIGNGGPGTYVYRNDAGTFVDIEAPLTGVWASAAVWGDYDHDGDLDFAFAGYTGAPLQQDEGVPAVPGYVAGGFLTAVYRNDAGTFHDAGAGLPGVYEGGLAWGDYDNDGDLDLLITGWSGQGLSRLYRNDDGAFSDVAAGLPGAWNSAVAWADYDTDGDLDLLLAGTTEGGIVSRLYRNDAGVLHDVGAGLPGVISPSLAWGDYDGDGDLDLLLAGDTGSGRITRIYRDDAGTFNDIAAGLPAVRQSAAAWGDYDNDGDPDLLLAGSTMAGVGIARVYRNDSGAFSDITAGLPGVYDAAAAWGDYDADGDLDIVLAGDTGGGRIGAVYRNDGAVANTPPEAPTGLFVDWFSDVVAFHWSAAADAETPAAGLSYNLRVGTTPGGSEIVSPMADGANGLRRIPAVGNASQRLSWPLIANPAPQTLYWSLQAVDAGLAGSAFAPEQISTPSTEDIAAGLPGVSGAAVAWGDYDADGDLDLLLAGDSGSGFIARVYRNDAGVFADIQAGLPGVASASAAWGDWDKDDDLDLVLCGDTGSGSITRLFRNDGGAFAEMPTSLPGVKDGSVAWGDYDSDGDLDLLIVGDFSRVYRNDAGVFTALIELPGVAAASAAWGDSDNDGDLDILLTGHTGIQRIARLYRYVNGSYQLGGPALTGVSNGAVDWGDYDGDGRLDFLLAGDTGSGYIARVYHNTGLTFTAVPDPLPGVAHAAAAWGDFDSDGDLDFLLAGETVGAGRVTHVYRNDAGQFLRLGGMPGVSDGAVKWIDYDNDGDLDVVLAGDTGSGRIARIYRVTGYPANTPPSPPAGLAASWNGNAVTLSWTAASDAETPAAGLSYNLRAGTTPGGSEISAAMSDTMTGYRRVPAIGNAGHRLSRTFALGALDSLYWSVQAVDAWKAGSPFTATAFTKKPEVPVEPPAPTPLADIGAGLPAVDLSSVAWGDYDDDGDLDFVITGNNLGPGDDVARLFLNVNDVFFDAGGPFPGVYGSSVAWGDYDNDNDLDLLFTGWTGIAAVARVYRNDGNIFHDIGAGLTGVRYSSVAWGDGDNDGDLDILLTGYTGSAAVSIVYRNDGGAFHDAGAGLPGVYLSSASWNDFDNDDDLDILLAGETGSGGITRVYRNDAGTFADVGAGLPGVTEGSAAWSDYDADGDADLVLTGQTAGGKISRVYRNDAGAFDDIGAVLPGVSRSSVAWGDHNNDGRPDLLITGDSGAADIADIYSGAGGTFADFDVNLPGLSYSSVAWGDFDADGVLDILLTGHAGTSNVSAIYRRTGTPNTPPGTPTGLTSSWYGNSVTLSWNAAADAETPSAGLTYNLRVGTSEGGSEILSAMAIDSSGIRRLPAPGNAGHRLSHTLAANPAQGVTWSVQAIDASFASSPFAPEQFSVPPAAVGDREHSPRFALQANVPNPFGAGTRLTFALPVSSPVTLDVFDINGRRVCALVDASLAAGIHTVTWNRTDDRGRHVAPGVYVARLQAGAFRATRRMVALR